MDQETLQGKFVVAMANEQHAQLTLVPDVPENRGWNGPVTISITGLPTQRFQKGTELYITFATQPIRVTSPAR